VGDAVAARVDAHTFQTNTAAIGASGFEQLEVQGAPMRVLRRIEGRCVFHAEGRCAIHAELGANAKPALCRRYPFNVAVDPDGIAHISINMECGGYARGRQGPLLSDTLGAELQVLLAVPALEVADACVVAPNHTVPYAVVFDALEAPWLEDLDRPEPLPAVLATLCGRLWDTEPETGVWPLPALQALSRTVAAYALQVAAQEAQRDPVDATLHHTLAAGAQAASTSAISPNAAVEDLLREQLRHAIFGKALHRAPSIASGLGHEIFKVWLIAQMAYTVADAVAAQRVVNRCLRASGLVDEAQAIELTQLFSGVEP
jgi:hypothetical protein